MFGSRPVVLLAALALGAWGCDDDSAESDTGTTDVLADSAPDTTDDAAADSVAEADGGADGDAPVEEPPTPEVEPGTIEQLGNPGMNAVAAAHEAAAPTDDEVVIYYVREDEDYEPWGVWIWANPGGDGAVHWDYTQDLEVVGGVAYLEFRRDGSDVGGVATVGEGGEFGFIIRQDADWIKDTPNDRFWDVDTSNEVVVFSGDPVNYPYGPYVPSFLEARLVTPTTIDVELSGRHALEVVPDDNGFIVRHGDESRTYAIADVQNADNLDDRAVNYTNHLLVTLSEPVELGPALFIDHESYLQPLRINDNALLLDLAESRTPSAEEVLGALYDAESGSVDLRLWSPLSSSVVAFLYDESGAETAAYEVALVMDDDTGVWSGTFDEVDPEGMFYDFRVVNGAGSNMVLDPYATSMDAYLGTGGAGRGAIIDVNAAQATPEGWDEDDYVELAQREDAIIYEIHVRDFTISPDSGVTGERGTYRAFIEKLPYLQELGVTHVQLLPVLNFYYTDETDRTYEDAGTANGNNYNWGYDPHNWFTPEGWYASDPADPYARVRELRELIVAIHDHGMGVLLDVVYNHVASPFLLDQIVPGYFFRTTSTGALTNASGVGNDFASTRTMARRMIVDSTRFWVEEYHVDGFRFDLMGLIDSETIEAAYAASAAVNPDVLFEGEGWKMYNGPAGTFGADQNYMDDTNDVAVFNDEVRDLLKGGGLNDSRAAFLTNQGVDTEVLFQNLIGQPQANYTVDDPGDSLAYMSAHDNLTLHDNIVYNTALDDDVLTERQEIIDRMQIGYFLILTSQSIPFLHGGDEMARTKPRLNSTSESIGTFVSNSYDASDNINQIVWTLDTPAQELADFVRGLIAIRRATPAFRLGDQSAVDAATRYIEHAHGRVLGYAVEHAGDTYVILANATDAAVVIDVGEDMTGADVLVDDDEANVVGVTAVTGVAIAGASVTLQAFTQALLHQAE